MELSGSDCSIDHSLQHCYAVTAICAPVRIALPGFHSCSLAGIFASMFSKLHLVDLSDAFSWRQTGTLQTRQEDEEEDEAGSGQWGCSVSRVLAIPGILG